MERLPSEILLMIFRRIDNLHERSRLEQVCRRWHQLVQNHGWKHVQQIALHNVMWIEPTIRAIGVRCGERLVECSLFKMYIDNASFPLIAKHFPALRHLAFRSCSLAYLDANTAPLEPFQALGTHLRSLTFCGNKTCNQTGPLYDQYPILRHFPRLRHLGLDDSCWYMFGSIPSHSFVDLRSLYLCYLDAFRPSIEIMMRKVQRDFPGLVALCLNIATVTEPELLRISLPKGLRFLRIAFQADFVGAEALCSCLANLPKLMALQLSLPIQQLSSVSRSPPFRGLVHLSLFLHHADGCPFDPYKSIGLLSTVAPKLRSISLNITGHSAELSQQVASELLMIAHNGILEHLDVPRASFTVEGLDQLIRLCPTLRSVVVQLRQNESLSQVAEMHRVAADQWRAGTRKQLPLRIWLYCHPDTAWRYIDPFLAIRTVQYEYGFTSLNPVLDELFRDEVFNDDNDGGAGTPSFVTELYSKNE